MSNNAKPPERDAGRPPKLLDQVRDRLRVKHYSNSIRTEAAPALAAFVHPCTAQAMWTGLNASSGFRASVIRRTWARGNMIGVHCVHPNLHLLAFTLTQGRLPVQIRATPTPSTPQATGNKAPTVSAVHQVCSAPPHNVPTVRDNVPAPDPEMHPGPHPRGCWSCSR